MISELTGLPVSNASVYEGPSALAAAAYLAQLHNGPLALRGLARACTRTRARRWRTTAAGWGTTVEEVPLRRRRHGRRGAARPRSTTTSRAVFLAPAELPRRRRGPGGAGAGRARRRARCWSCQVDPMTLGVLRPPGDFGVDVAVGEGQPLGNRLDFGGPSFGFFAAQQALPAPHAGTHRGGDDGRRRAPRLRAHAADARAAHPAREGDLEHLHRPGAQRAGGHDLPVLARAARASSELGELLLRRTALRARARWPRSTACELAARRAGRARVRRPRSTRRCERGASSAAGSAGVNPGYPLGRDYPEHEDGLLVAITEQRTRADIDRLADGAGSGASRPSARRRAIALSDRRPRLRSSASARRRSSRSPSPGRRAFVAPALDVPESARWTSCCRRASRRTDAPKLPEVSEPEIIATTTGCPSATSTSTPASTRSARAR